MLSIIYRLDINILTSKHLHLLQICTTFCDSICFDTAFYDASRDLRILLPSIDQRHEKHGAEYLHFSCTYLT